MDPESTKLLLTTTAVFTGVAAVALLIMMGMMIGVYRSARLLQQRSNRFMDRLEPLVASTQSAVEDLRAQTGPVLADVRRLTESGRKQMDRLDELVDDVHASARLQIQRIDGSVEDCLRKVDETSEALRKAVLGPVRRIHGVAAAVSAVLDHLGGARRRPTVDKATIDEEMFI